MANGIHQELRQTESREAQLWYLVLGLVLLLGGVMLVSLIVVLGEVLPAASSTFVWTRRALLGLAFVLSAFCIHLVYARTQNRHLKELLVEMSRMAASGKNLDQFLPSLASRLRRAGGATSCHIALVDEATGDLALQAFAGPRPEGPGPSTPVRQAMADLPLCRSVMESGQPLVMTADEVSRCELDTCEAAFLGRQPQAASSLALIPMTRNERSTGLLILKRRRAGWWRRFEMAQVQTTHALAAHAADAIEQLALRRQAVYDPLTGIYNRRHFSSRLHEEMIRARRDGQIMVILLCDMDNFRHINDSGGHQQGDKVLKAVAESMRSSTRGSDLVFRWGGDEMVVILSNSTRDGGLRVARRIKDGVRRTGASLGLPLDLSIGVSLYPEHGDSEDELINAADRALYIAKKSGRGIHVGEEEYELTRKSIKVVFQPIVDTSGNKVIGYEALTRDPSGQMDVSQFFKKFHAIGQLTELKQLIFKCQVQVARELGLRRVFINADFDVLNRIEKIPRLNGTEVVVELSELEALHDLDKHLLVAERWRRHGYQFAIDDFGAGFISLPFLAMLIPDYVKVDRSTILQAVASEKFRRFLKTLLHGVRSYARTGIVAEGVEEERELRFVHEMGISLVQGYFYGEPRELQEPPADSLAQEDVSAMAGGEPGTQARA